MRTLLASDDARARFAVELFVYRIGRELGSLAAAAGGIDALVFTAGIGEHAPVIREQACRDAAWLGVVLDPVANQAGGPRISAAASKVPVWVIPTNEELMIARHTVEDRGSGGAMNPLLKGFKVLVCGIANEHSIAYGCAKAFHELGANLAITYLNEKSKGYVEPLARQLEAPIFMPLDVSQAGRARSRVRADRQGVGQARCRSCTPSPGRPRTTCRAAC